MNELQVRSNSEDMPANSADISLLSRCLDSSPRYKIPEHLRDRIVSRLGSLLESEDHGTAIKAAQTMVKMDAINVTIFKALKTQRREVINVTKLSDQELLAAIKNVEKYLPPVIDCLPENSDERKNPHS